MLYTYCIEGTYSFEPHTETASAEAVEDRANILQDICVGEKDIGVGDTRETLFGLASLFPNSKTFAAYYMGHISEKENNPVDILSGAFMIIKKELFEQLGGFDESFFMYGEDIDLSYRLAQSGYINYYLGEITITHQKGGSTKYNSEYIKNFYGAMNIFVKKHYAGKKSKAFVWMILSGVRIRKMIAWAGLLFR